ncbi:hypothetical protein [Bradyrhizobium tunisiense]|uniref:hypothetical protein n=1 Tax=Bradyrhizobium tunisiense TaxID=3278709 RepID=UPI0035D8ECAE
MFRRLVRMLPAETLDGYDHPQLVETVFRKTIAYSPTEPWAEMINVRSVLDFGGGCGRHYREAKVSSVSVKWAIVETPAMVSRAKELQTPQFVGGSQLS